MSWFLLLNLLNIPIFGIFLFLICGLILRSLAGLITTIITSNCLLFTTNFTLLTYELVLSWSCLILAIDFPSYTCLPKTSAASLQICWTAQQLQAYILQNLLTFISLGTSQTHKAGDYNTQMNTFLGMISFNDFIQKLNLIKYCPSSIAIWGEELLKGINLRCGLYDAG